MRTRNVVLAALLLAAGQLAPAAELTVLFTSDMHARVLPYDDVRQRPGRGSLAQVKSYVDAIRAEVDNLLMLDGGDALQGTPLAHYALATPLGDGQDPTIAAMNLIGYDAAVLGNHEFNFGLDVLRRSLGQARFPWLAANLEGAQRERLPVYPHLLLKRGNVRIAVLGLTNPNIPHWDPPSHLGSLAFGDPVEAAAVQVAALRARADIVIVLLHSGFERNLATGEPDGSDYENFAWRVAHVPGIDLLLTGHTHEDIPPRRLGDTIVAQPGRWAEMVTRIDLVLGKRSGRWRIVSWRGANVPMASQPADPAVAAAVERLQARVAAELARVVGELREPLVLGGVPTRDDAAVDLVHAVQLEVTGAQLSLAAPLAAARQEVPAGPLPVRAMHALYPYPNTVLMVEVTGAQLRDIVEHAVRGWEGLDCARPQGCTLLRDPRVPYYSFDTLQGATYFVNPLAPVGQRVYGLRVGGAAVDPAATYTLAVNSYRAVGGGNFPHLLQARRLKEVTRPMVELLVEHVARLGSVALRADDNWAFAIPLAEAAARPAGPAQQ
ncbi:MAG TPA: bifunctional UDP-sugar hydrolase/5'-nucleotidase [Thermoanaerobaculaceae bacterium]|nr:bifunctional UDP-sugar hydrolase/5'-nucleotidase [Thermoanaerobaculaceae bacterium]HRS16952.1 bifunctional UDP-sugar hydrolase/5'-nucleotidase [Thermoanaerobaculaceae bacterium]